MTQIEGRIALGERLAIRVPITSRTFKVTVDIVEPPARLVWSAGSAAFRGVRIVAAPATPASTATS